MQHLGTKIIETNRLLLRRFEMSDAGMMYRNWACDKDVTEFLTWQAHDSVDITKSVLEEWVSSYDKDDFYNWAIVLKELAEPVGGISVVMRNDDIRMVHIGYCIGKKWWRQGITTEALSALIKFFFEEVGVNRIEARHDPRNPNSGKVMAKCQMKYEGTKRQADINNKGICDYAEYAVLAEDYFGKGSLRTENTPV